MRTSRLVQIVAFFALLAIQTVVAGETPAAQEAEKRALSVPRIFGDNMVLQRDVPIPVWGRASKGEQVTVSFGDQEKTATVGDDDKWSVKLDPLPAEKKPRELTIKGTSTLTFKNVVVGEVWVCSGQSNMEWSVGGCLNLEKEKAAATNPLIRHIKVGKAPEAFPAENINGGWVACAPDTVPSFTAAGFFFAREIAQALDVPVGLIGSNWGGTRIEPWTPLEGFRLVPELNAILKQVEDSYPSSEAGQARYAEYFSKMKAWVANAEAATAAKRLPPPMPPVPWLGGEQGTPTKLYNGMIAPIVPYAIRGALWYQGEANSGECETYVSKTKALVGGWRKVWGQGDFPFYWVQLANYQKSDPNNTGGGDGFARCREAQRLALSIPNTGMAVIIDIGETNDIHPKNKQDVGKRLALWALAKTYGKELAYSGPLYKSHKVEGNKVVIEFEHAAGLMIGRKQGLEPVQPMPDAKLKWFAVAGEDKKFFWAEAAIEGDTVVLTCPTVEKPVAARYAFTANPDGPLLYNKEGLPASPFKTDNW